MTEDQSERLIAAQIALTQSIGELVNVVGLLLEQGTEPEDDEEPQPIGTYLMDGTRII